MNTNFYPIKTAFSKLNVKRFASVGPQMVETQYICVVAISGIGGTNKLWLQK